MSKHSSLLLNRTLNDNQLSGAIPDTLTRLGKTTNFKLHGNSGLCRLDTNGSEVTDKCTIPFFCPYPFCPCSFEGAACLNADCVSAANTNTGGAGSSLDVVSPAVTVCPAADCGTGGIRRPTHSPVGTTWGSNKMVLTLQIMNLLVSHPVRVAR
jgi:hypothetical protein